jgi:hypothetical protein
MTCPHCLGDARCVGWRRKGVVGLLGDMRLQRHYYHCRRCGQGFCPWDQVLGLNATDLTPAADEVVCLAGVQASFGTARDWAWHRDAEDQTVAYVSADATGVGQQGPGGSKVPGRMANVVAIYNPVPEERARWAEPTGRRPAWQARYLASLRPLVDLGPVARRLAAQVGLERVQRWIALSDGGSGLEDFLRDNFGRVEAVILDFYHAAEHLGDLAKAWHPADEAAARALAGAWCHQLKEEGGQTLLGVLRGLDLRGKSKATRTLYQETVGYFVNQVHRMDYPAYRAKGWQIGSGPVESACKTVVGQRLKGTGMRWGEDGADAVCQLRALFRSEASQWDAFWTRN